MFNLLLKDLDHAKKILEEEDVSYKLVNYSSRFKDDITTDSVRVIRQRMLSDGTVELVLSDFKTNAQG